MGVVAPSEVSGRSPRASQGNIEEVMPEIRTSQRIVSARPDTGERYRAWQQRRRGQSQEPCQNGESSRDCLLEAYTQECTEKKQAEEQFHQAMEHDEHQIYHPPSEYVPLSNRPIMAPHEINHHAPPQYEGSLSGALSTYYDRIAPSMRHSQPEPQHRVPPGERTSAAQRIAQSRQQHKSSGIATGCFNEIFEHRGYLSTSRVVPDVD